MDALRLQTWLTCYVLVHDATGSRLDLDQRNAAGSLRNRRRFRRELAADQERQTLIGAWMSGYFSASKNLNAVDFRYVDRNQRVIGKYCKAHRSDTVMNAMQKNWK
jgi:hypothetical protein